jgi:hypothetical protein
MPTDQTPENNGPTASGLGSAIAMLRQVDVDVEGAWEERRQLLGARPARQFAPRSSPGLGFLRVLAFAAAVLVVVGLIAFGSIEAIRSSSKPETPKLALPRLPLRWRYVNYYGFYLGIPGSWARGSNPTCPGSSGVFLTPPNNGPAAGSFPAGPHFCETGPDNLTYVFFTKGQAFTASPFLNETVNGMKVLVSTSQPSVKNGRYAQLAVVIPHRVIIDIDTGMSLALATKILETLHEG